METLLSVTEVRLTGQERRAHGPVIRTRISRVLTSPGHQLALHSTGGVLSRAPRRPSLGWRDALNILGGSDPDSL